MTSRSTGEMEGKKGKTTGRMRVRDTLQLREGYVAPITDLHLFVRLPQEKFGFYREELLGLRTQKM